MRNKPLKRFLSAALAVTMLTPMAVLPMPTGFSPLVASAAAVVDSGELGGGTYTLDSEGTLTITGDTIEIGADAFAGKVLQNIIIDAEFVKLHPDAFRGIDTIETICFTRLDGTTIQGALYGLPETATVTMQPFSKIYTPAQKYLYGPSVAYDTYRPAYAHAILYWEDTEEILEAAAADGVSISDSKETLEWITNDNIGTYFTDVQASIIGTMEGDGSFENPYLIWDAQNWRYLDYLGRLGKLSSSYYGWDRGTNVKLMADITLSDRDGTFTTLGGGKHREVHNSGYTYTGNFDGNGHTITLDVNESINDGTAGFGLIESTGGAYIKNLHISGRMVSSETNTGLLVGYASSHDRIYNCSSDAELVLLGSGEFNSGALIGCSYCSYLENCHFTGSIIGDDPAIPDGEDDGTTITAVGGFIGETYSSSGIKVMKNCYFAPSEIKVSSTKSCILYRPYYGSYSGWCGVETIENNYYNAEALKLGGADMGDLDQGMSDAEGVDSLNETEFWEDGQITMPKATAEANPGTRNFVYTGGEHRIFMDLQADAYNGGGTLLARGESFPYMPGYAHDGIAQYKVNDGAWSATPPLATDVGEYTVYYRAAGDAYHRDSDIQSIQVTIAEPQELPGSGTAADPYTISNDLEWSIFCEMHDTKDKYFKLVNDIVVSENRESKRGNNHPCEFNGTFDGDGHKITLYYVSRGSSDSLFGKIVGHSDYYDSEAGGWHYWHASVKNLVVDGIMYGANYLSPIANTISRGGTVSNIISNMTLVNLAAGGDTNTAGIVHTGDLSGGVHFYNCKVNGKFSAMNGNQGFEGISFMNDFWQSGTDFLIKDCYVDPVCEDIKAASNNYAIMRNYVEGKSTIENCFYGQSILGIIPVDEETGETTNTQGISDANGLDALYATGYWADGNPTMPKATITKAAEKTTLLYTEEEAVVINEETNEEETVMQAVSKPLIEEQTSEGGTVWYQVNGGEWTTEVPTAAEAGKYTVKYKAVGDYLHRDSETQTSVTNIVYDWATPTNVTVTLEGLSYTDYGSFNSDSNAAVIVGWDDNDDIERCGFTAEIVTPDGRRGTFFEDAPVAHEYWNELSQERPAAKFFVGLLSPEEEQVFENGRVNGAKYGDTLIITATGFITVDGNEIGSVPADSIDLALGISNEGKTFPVLPEGMSNDSGIKEDLVVLGDEVLAEGLASGGRAPYQFEVSLQKEGESDRTVLQAYSSNQIVRFTPSAAGRYNVHINAKDSEGNISGKDLTLTVNKVLANLSQISAEEIVIGDSVTVSAAAEGGIGEYRYQLSCRKTGTENWDEMVSVYGTESEGSFTPDSTGTYEVRVNIRDDRGTVVTKSFTVKVNKLLENLSVISENEIVIRGTVKVTAAVEGGIAPYQYEVSFKHADSSKFTVSQAYSSNTTVNVKPGKVGNYTIRINAKDSRGVVVTKDIEVKVNKELENLSTVSADEIVLRDTVTVTANAEGGIAPYKYEVSFKHEDSASFTVKQNYSTNARVSVKPGKAGNYTIRVKVKDSKGTVVTKDIEVKVNKLLANLSAISENEIVVGETAAVTASGEGGIAPYQYQVTMTRDDSDELIIVQTYSENDNIAVTPAAPGNYTVKADLKDSRGVVETKTFELKVNKLLENHSVISTDEIVLRDTVTVNAAAEGGLAPYQYEVSFKHADSAGFTVKQAYSENTAVDVKPGKTGEYIIRINAKDARGTVVTKDYYVTVNKALENSSAVSAEEIVLNDSVTITAAADGGIAPYQYEVTYNAEGSDEIKTLSSYSSDSSVIFTPASVGNYTIQVNARDSRGVVETKSFELKVNKQLENLSGVSATEIVIRGTVKVTASAEGGIAPYKYEVSFKHADSTKFTVSQAYGTNQTVSVKPGKTGIYTIRVNVKDSRGIVSAKDFEVKVNKALENHSAVSAEEIVLRDTVTVNAAAEGGIAPYTYKVSFKHADSASFTVKQNYSSNPTVAVKPGKAGDYLIRVYAKDSKGTVVTKDISVTVNKQLANLSSIVEEDILLGDYVMMDAAAEGGLGAYTYDFKYKNSSSDSWTTLGTEFGNEAEACFKPTSAASYDIRISVKDGRDVIVEKNFTVNVHPVLKNNSVIEIDDTVTVTAKATGGIGEYTYLMRYKKSAETTWTTIGTDKTGTFEPETNVYYDVIVKVTDAAGNVKAKRFSFCVPAELENTSSVAAESISFGEKIEITGSASGGTGSYTFAYYYKRDNASKWTAIGQPYTENISASIKPVYRGKYLVKVIAQDELGETSVSYFEVTLE